MTVQQLNEFSIFNKKPNKPQVSYTVSNHTAKYTIVGIKVFDRFALSHKSENEGGGYEIRVRGAGHTFNDVTLTLDDAIVAIGKEVDKWKKEAKASKGTETSPADLPDIKKSMFNLNKLKKELRYERK